MKKPDTAWFVNDRFGLFIHWGLYALAARHEWVKSAEEISTADYQKYFDQFNPDLFNPKIWAKNAKEAGMKYFVITAKHHEGFCLWNTKHTDYKCTKTPYGKEILKDVVKAFRDEGLKVGFYYSLLDWHHPEYTIDRHHPMRNNAAEKAKDAKRDMRKYAKYMRDQVTELLTQYGKIDILWFDFSFPGNNGKGCKDWESEKLLALIRKLQPNVLIDNRLDLPGSGNFVTPEQIQPDKAPVDDKGQPVVWEACQTFSGSWGYFRDENTWKTPHQLLYMLIDGVSKNGNLLLNVGPTARGEFDYRACERLAAMGAWMKYHNRSIYGCGAAPKGLETPPDCRYTYNDKTKRLYVHILSWPFMHIHCKGLAGKVKYAQFLNDASEVKIENKEEELILHLPKLQPNTEIPVIELFLSEKK